MALRAYSTLKGTKAVELRGFHCCGSVLQELDKIRKDIGEERIIAV